MRLYLDYTTKGQSLCDYQGDEFLSTEDACDFAEATAQAMKNERNFDWTGWSIEVRNAEGRKFLSLPVDAGKQNVIFSPHNLSANEGWDQPGKNPRSVLIIEDALIHSAIIGRVVVKVGFAATRAHSYEAACEALTARQFDCITLDLGLGEHVGLDVLHHLSTIACRAQIIVISQADKDACEDMVQLGRALDLDVCASMSKPIDLDVLRTMLVNVQAQAQPAYSPV